MIEVSVEAPAPGWQDELRAEVAPWLSDFGADMYAFGDGELAQANAQWKTGGCVAASDTLRAVAHSAATLEQRHGDRFVPALADITRLWRLHDTDTANWQPPSPAEISAAMTPRPSMQYLDERDGQLCAGGPVALDSGGFAKGLVLDRLIDALQRRGWSPALVNVGGDLVALGERAARPWRVGIKDPAGPGALASFPVFDGEAVMTSGDYARGFTLGKTRYAHILDPATGWPVQGIASVTVVGERAAATDAAATALFVAAGRAHAAGLWPDLPAVADADAFVVVAADGSVAVSAALAARIDWASPGTVRHVLP